jgi:hypothetical protein
LLFPFRGGRESRHQGEKKQEGKLTQSSSPLSPSGRLIHIEHSLLSGSTAGALLDDVDADEIPFESASSATAVPPIVADRAIGSALTAAAATEALVTRLFTAGLGATSLTMALILGFINGVCVRCRGTEEAHQSSGYWTEKSACGFVSRVRCVGSLRLVGSRPVVDEGLSFSSRLLIAAMSCRASRPA